MLSPSCVPLIGAPFSLCAERPTLPVIPLATRKLDDLAMPMKRNPSQRCIIIVFEAPVPLCVPLNLSSLIPS